jgi:hypothetical protein
METNPSSSSTSLLQGFLEVEGEIRSLEIFVKVAEVSGIYRRNSWLKYTKVSRLNEVFVWNHVVRIGLAFQTGIVDHYRQLENT